MVGWMRAPRRGRVTMDDASLRARRGASFLDEALPGWWRDVDSWSLDLASDGACVLGHLHGSFRLGLARSGVFSVSSAPRASFSPVELGFHCVQGIDEVLQEQDYVFLNRAWRDEIRLRQDGADGDAAGGRSLRSDLHLMKDRVRVDEFEPVR